jgi:hypothetical protein
MLQYADRTTAHLSALEVVSLQSPVIVSTPGNMPRRKQFASAEKS